MRKRFIVLILLIVTLFMGEAFAAKELIVTAEASDYKKTSTYADVMNFLSIAQQRSDLIRLATLTTSTEGRRIPLVIVSKEGIKSPKELAMSGKPAVVIMANIHAGEIEGKEATLMLIREFVQKKASALAYLENQVVLIIPIFNADGNDKFGKNRRDNGPELAGVRHNGQHLDLNRDFLKLESPEVNGLVKLLNTWDPVLLVDMHTTNGSYHQEPVTYTTQINPNGDTSLSQYMWDKFFPAVSKTLEKTYGYFSCPYGNFVDRRKPSKGWRNHAFHARYGTNYIGMRNRFTILDENYSHADFKTRVLASFGFIRSILQYTSKHIGEMEKMCKEADKKTAASFYKGSLSLEFKTEHLFDFTIKSYEFKIEKIKPEDRHKYPPWIRDFIVKKTDKLRDYKVPYFTKAVSTRGISLPEGYVIMPHNPEVINNLKRHGIAVERISRTVESYPVEVFNIKDIKTAKRLYQGHVAVTLSGEYQAKEKELPEGAYFVSMKQPLARIIPILLEPESNDSLAAWGYFDRKLVRQWSGRPNPYPIYRIPKVTKLIPRYQE